MQAKFTFTSFLISGSFLLCVTLVQAQTWRSINGPLESSISKIIVQKDTVYAISTELGGFFKKHKTADHWVFMDIVFAEDSYRAEIEGLKTIEINPNGTYYAGGSGLNIDGEYFNHFYVSRDFGKSWGIQRKGINYYTGPELGVHDIFISASGTLMIGFGDGIFTYVEEEHSFKQTSGNAGIPTNRLFTFHEYGDTLLAGRVTGLEYSTDDGNSWTASSFDSVGVLALEYTGDKLFVGTNQGLFTSISVNGTFEIVEDLAEGSVQALHTYQDQVIAGTDSGTFLINLGTLQVQPVFQEDDLVAINAINNAEDILFLGTNNGLYECNLEDERCTRSGLPNSWVRAQSIPNQDTLFVGTTRSIYRYAISSERWDSLSVPIGSARSFIPVSTDSFFTISGRYFLECSFQNNDCDSTQIDLGNTLFNLTRNIVGDLFVVSTNSVFQSKDHGNTWNTIFDFDTNRRGFKSPIFTVSDSLIFFDGAEQGLVKYLLNTGNYSIIGFEETAGINAYYFTSSGSIYVSSYSSIHKSTDLGETWTTLLHPSDVIGGNFLIEVLYDETAEKLYAIGTGGRVYVSKNEGTTWGVNEDMVPIYLENAAVDHNGSLYLGTRSAGVFKNTKPLDPPITISNEFETISVPKSFVLHQNYPNPFNPSTTISFELSQPQSVSLDVFNIFGQRVLTKNLGKITSGIHSQSINLSNYASGMYFLMLKSGQQTQSIKMLMIK